MRRCLLRSLTAWHAKALASAAAAAGEAAAWAAAGHWHGATLQARLEEERLRYSCEVEIAQAETKVIEVAKEHAVARELAAARAEERARRVAVSADTEAAAAHAEAARLAKSLADAHEKIRGWGLNPAAFLASFPYEQPTEKRLALTVSPAAAGLSLSGQSLRKSEGSVAAARITSVQLRSKEIKATEAPNTALRLTPRPPTTPNPLRVSSTLKSV